MAGLQTQRRTAWLVCAFALLTSRFEGTIDVNLPGSNGATSSCRFGTVRGFQNAGIWESVGSAGEISCSIIGAKIARPLFFEPKMKRDSPMLLRIRYMA